jgi:hypothetical protein
MSHVRETFRRSADTHTDAAIRSARHPRGARLQHSFAVFAGRVAMGEAAKAVHAIALQGGI